MEKVLLNNGVPWEVIQEMNDAEVMSRYSVWSLPFLENKQGLL